MIPVTAGTSLGPPPMEATTGSSKVSQAATEEIQVTTDYKSSVHVVGETSTYVTKGMAMQFCFIMSSPEVTYIAN